MARDARGARGSCPPPAAWMTPAMMARTTRPSTSSITAAPRMMRALGVLMAFASCRTRAVIPTEVAASIAPRNACAIQDSPGEHQLADAVAEGHRRHDPHEGDDGRGDAHRHHVLRGRLEADLEEQQDRPELGQDREGLARLERGEAGPAEEGEVAEEDAEEQLAEDGGLAHAARRARRRAWRRRGRRPGRAGCGPCSSCPEAAERRSVIDPIEWRVYQLRRSLTGPRGGLSEGAPA